MMREKDLQAGSWWPWGEPMWTLILVKLLQTAVHGQLRQLHYHLPSSRRWAEPVECRLVTCGTRPGRLASHAERVGPRYAHCGWNVQGSSIGSIFSSLHCLKPPRQVCKGSIRNCTIHNSLFVSFAILCSGVCNVEKHSYSIILWDTFRTFKTVQNIPNGRMFDTRFSRVLSLLWLTFVTLTLLPCSKS